MHQKYKGWNTSLRVPELRSKCRISPFTAARQYIMLLEVTVLFNLTGPIVESYFDYLHSH